jgi:hypothetical protein
MKPKAGLGLTFRADNIRAGGQDGVRGEVAITHVAPYCKCPIRPPSKSIRNVICGSPDPTSNRIASKCAAKKHDQ